ncbi:hypothetical protein KEH51_26170 [[Brevibacterium] frigoritolerans]|uniref:Uncharacterized protein n=1 Tax=Peribacillus frigoritolerans TaxID=450367 RepID=A0A941JBU9_9BACI|nr:hypothetical protein [Peribacillus frigoritolerans]
MNHLQKQILSFLEECNRERCVSKIAEKYDKNLEVVRAELVILANKKLIAIKKSTTGKISRATISQKVNSASGKLLQLRVQSKSKSMS